MVVVSNPITPTLAFSLNLPSYHFIKIYKRRVDTKFALRFSTLNDTANGNLFPNYQTATGMSNWYDAHNHNINKGDCKISNKAALKTPTLSTQDSTNQLAKEMVSFTTKTMEHVSSDWNQVCSTIAWRSFTLATSVFWIVRASRWAQVRIGATSGKPSIDERVSKTPPELTMPVPQNDNLPNSIESEGNFNDQGSSETLPELATPKHHPKDNVSNSVESDEAAMGTGEYWKTWIRHSAQNTTALISNRLGALWNKLGSGEKTHDWVTVAHKSGISPGQIIPVKARGKDLLLVASKDGTGLYCVANSCPHLGTPLEGGSLETRPTESFEIPVSTTVAASNSCHRERNVAPCSGKYSIPKSMSEDCIVCPLHKTAFALKNGNVRGEWCPYPPILGKVVGTVNCGSALPVFDVRTKGKNIEVRLDAT